MKKTRNFFMTIVMAFVMLFAAFAPFVGVNKKQASALSPDYTAGSSDVIYYFCDLYPSIDYQTLMDTYHANEVILDRQPVNEQEFAALVNTGYFLGFREGDVVVIDIKTFNTENSSVLNSLLGDLKINQGCTVILVTPDILSSSYGDIDAHYRSELHRLKNFLKNTIKYIDGNNPNGLQGVQILIDGNFVHADAYSSQDMQYLCGVSPFVCTLLDVFCDYLCVSSYDAVIEDLTDFSLKLLVDVGNDTYLDILTGSNYSENSLELSNTYAIGSWTLDNDFYNFLYNNSLVSFMIEGDPFSYGPNGLAAITEWELAAVYGSEGDEATPLIDTLNDLLN